MTYILFMVIKRHSGDTIAINQEFNTLQACQNAGEEIKRQAGYASTEIFVCAPKGEKE